MLAKLKGIFGPAGRVDLDRRFSIACETPQGSMSKTYRAVDKQTGRMVCLKVQLAEKQSAAEQRAQKLNRPSEGAIASQIIHPNVVRTLEHGVASTGASYLVMEYVDGVSLKFVREATRTGVRAKVKLLAEAAEGLAAVHAAGFIHHDVNPNNFLVTRDNTVKVIDFGLAVPNTAEFHRPGNRTGMLQYMAPELIRRESTDERIDIFSFGVVAYELLTNQMPFGGGSNALGQMTAKINAEPADPAVANPRLSDDLCDILRQTLRKKPARWPKMATLAEALRDVKPKREGAGKPDPADDEA